MIIISAQFTESGSILVNDKMHVPDTEHDRERWDITAWISKGNNIAPYIVPPKSTIPSSDEMLRALWKNARGDSIEFNNINLKVGF